MCDLWEEKNFKQKGTSEAQAVKWEWAWQVRETRRMPERVEGSDR